MKLSEHVEQIRTLINNAFDKQFARLGFGSKNQLDIEKIPADLHGKRKRYYQIIENHIGETGSYENAREKALDELTFTLFNRIAAIKVIEAASIFPPIITKQTEHGDRSFGHKAWLEERPDMRSEELEGIREYIKHAFNELGKTIFLYNKDYPYAFLPDPVALNEIIDAFNAVELDSQVGENIWISDDILGWLYESYNAAKKKAFKDSNEKVEYDKVSLQSQVYTPRWVVQFLVDNSLGKLYLEMYPDSEIKDNHKIANAPQSRTREPKPVHEIKMIDPAAGSGNFLLYAFDLFYEFYLDQIEYYGADYEEKDVPKLIIENNLHGIDLDDRAIQLAQIGLYIKAMKKRRGIDSLNFNVVSSDFFLPEYDVVREIFETDTGLDHNQKELIEEIWGDLQYAYKFGSLIRLNERLKNKIQSLQQELKTGDHNLFDELTKSEIAEYKAFENQFFKNLEVAVEKYAHQNGKTFLTNKAQDAITFLKLLTTKYDIATANPPYSDSADFGSDLKAFIEDNYKKPHKFHSNLYASFIKQCYEFTIEDGKIALIHPHTFMFIKTLEDVRKFIINKTNINVMVDFGLDRVNLFGPGILLDATFYVLSKSTIKKDGLFFNLSTNLQEKYKKEKFLEALHDFIQGRRNERVYELEQSKLKIIKSWPFIYWISDEFREKFKLPPISEYVDIKSGLATANNNRFLRYWWEVNIEDISKDHMKDKKKWVRYAKGGTFNKWYGNLWLVVNWGLSGEEMKETKRAVFRNKQFYFKKGITYSATSTKGTSFRVLPKNCVYDVKGASAFIEGNADFLYILSLFNSKLSSYIINCLNSTVETQVGDIKRVPYATPKEELLELNEILVSRNIDIKIYLSSFSLVEPNFSSNPINNLAEYSRIETSIKKLLNLTIKLQAQVLINEHIIENLIFDTYDLNDVDQKIVLNKEGNSIGGLVVDNDAIINFLAENESVEKFSLDYIRTNVERLPVKEFSTIERDNIEREFTILFQKNNDLEEFCKRHQVNPINVWYWFTQNNVIPKQRMNDLALEFLADMIREILMEDEDGIIPLVPNAGEKILFDRIQDKFHEKGFSAAQFSSLDSILNRNLNEYLNYYFFQSLSDHLNLFPNLPKTPFIWHLSSGPEQGFDCYIIIYKWDKDKLYRLRSVYIEQRERALINRQSDLTSDQSAKAQNEKEKISKQLKEIKEFRRKIDELLEEGYDPVLDDGVGKNIAPLQNKGMIPYEVLNAGQLKKYLNADW